jgi:RNA polymerase sigma factor (sigma-70 family)
MTDVELLEASGKGDSRAFGRLIEHHHAAVTAVAFATTRDLATSEQIAQDTFIVAWTQLHELRDPTRFRAWLCGIARNLSSNGDRQCDVSDIDAVRLASSDTVDALGLIEAAEAEHSVRSALFDLPARYREPLVLFYWERSIERVASALELSVAVAQKRIAQARSMITRELAEQFATTAKARRPAKSAAAAVVAMIETNGGRVNRAGRKAAADALPMRMTVAVPAAATVAAIAIITGVVWLL